MLADMEIAAVAVSKVLVGRQRARRFAGETRVDVLAEVGHIWAWTILASAICIEYAIRTECLSLSHARGLYLWRQANGPSSPSTACPVPILLIWSGMTSHWFKAG